MATSTERSRIYAHRLRAQGLAAMGGKCACCGEAEPAFLTLDHVQNDGSQHRGRNREAWRVARDCGYDPARFRILCYNCNCGRRHGPCPHERKKT